MAPCILNLGARWSCVISFTPRSLYPGEGAPRMHCIRGLVGPQRRSGHGGEERKTRICVKTSVVVPMSRSSA
jgi:hypothetical protein